MVVTDLQLKEMIDSAIQNVGAYLKDAESLAESNAIPLQTNKNRIYKAGSLNSFLISLRNCLRRQAQRNHCFLLKN